MDQDAIIEYIVETFDGVDVEAPTDGVGAGDTFFIYDPRRNFEPKHRFPFATIVAKNYTDWDEASNLDRPGVFRLNIGVSRDTFRSLFPPAASFSDPAALDLLMPHPVYAVQSWVSVLNPSNETFATVRPLLAEAYGLALKRQGNRQPADSGA